jgi:hypothetical protein
VLVDKSSHDSFFCLKNYPCIKTILEKFKNEMADNKKYDDMTPEEQAEHDRIAREKEAAEQAGKYI